MNKIQKIREEVEKLKSNLVYGACSSQVAMETHCKEEAYNEVLAILDSQQEEHEPHYPSFEESQGEVILYGLTGNVGVQEKPTEEVPVSEDLDLGCGVIWKDNKESVSEDLEKEIDSYIKNNFFSSEAIGFFSNKTKEELNDKDVAEVARHFANWQREQMEKYRIEHCNSITNEQAELEEDFVASHIEKNNRMPTFLDAIEWGMNLKQQQMMKEAVNATVGFRFHRLSIDLKDNGISGFESGDKVKLIIVKED